LLFALKSGEQPKIALGLAFFAQMWSFLGLSWLGRQYLRRARHLETVIDEPALAGNFHFSRGIGEYWDGGLKTAESQFEIAVPLLARCCQFVELQYAVHMHRHALAYTGDSNSELDKARAVLELATTTGNVQGICWGFYDVASVLARAGELAEAVCYMKQANFALTNERFLMTSAIRASTDGYVRLQCSVYLNARHLAEFAWSVVKEGWVAIDVTLLCVPILIESIAGRDWLEPLPSADLKSMKRALKRASLLYVTLPNQQAHLCRVSARAHVRMGNPRKAIRKFEKAILLAEKKGMKYQQAKSLLDLAAVKEDGRDENRAKAIRLLEEMKSVIPRAEAWLLGDQYDEAVVAPAFDLAAWEAEHGPVTPYLEADK
jgi:tetratricopeptide (TPR) repeat protein